MRCEDLEEKLIDYSEGLLQGADLRRVEEHLRGCAPCRQELALLKASWDCLEAWQPIEPSPMLRARVWEEIRHAPQPTPWKVWAQWLGRAWGGLSLGVVSLAAGLFCLLHLGLLTAPRGVTNSSANVVALASAAPTATPQVQEPEAPTAKSADHDDPTMDWQLGGVEILPDPTVGDNGDDPSLRLGTTGVMDTTHQALLDSAEDA